MNSPVSRRGFLQRSSVVAASLAGAPWVAPAADASAAPRRALDFAAVRKPLATFAVITDTHYAVGADGRAPHPYLARATETMAEMQAAGAEFALHLGDLVNSFPGDPRFAAEVRLARAQLAASRMPIYAVPGNHDVGQKPSLVSPGHAAQRVRQEWVDGYLQQFRADYQAFDRAGCRVILLNAMLFNTSLPREQQQWDRLRADLDGAADLKVVLGLHVPVFWHRPDDAGPGNYDVIDEPVRGKLLELILKHKVRIVFSGHAHRPIVNTYGNSLLLTAPSTTFGRTFGFYPGVPEIVTDPAKRGWLLVRVYEDDLIVNRVRTRASELPEGAKVLVTRQSFENARCHLATMFPAPRGVAPQQAPPAEGKPAVPAGPARRMDDATLAAADLGVRYVRVIGAINTPDYAQALLAAARLGQRTVTSLPPEPKIVADAVRALGKVTGLIETSDAETFAAAVKAAGGKSRVMVGPVSPERLGEALALDSIWVSVLLEGKGKTGLELAQQALALRNAHPKRVFWFDIANGPTDPAELAHLFLLTYGLGVVVNPLPAAVAGSGALLDRGGDPTPAHLALRTLASVLGEPMKRTDGTQGALNRFWFAGAGGRFVEALWTDGPPMRVALGEGRAGATLVDLTTGLAWSLPADGQVVVGKLPTLVCKL